MTAAALALVLPSATAHATWNLLAKRSGGGLPFVWLSGVLSAVAVAPLALAVALAGDAGLDAGALPWVAGSAAIHGAYFLALQRGYRHGDLSVVYPLARGTGPLLALAGAVLLLAESPSPLSLLGAASILGAILLIGVSAVRQASHPRIGIAYALATGCLIAAYTLWDKRGVDELGVQPLVYLCGIEVVRAGLLLPFALRRRDEVAFEWNEHRREVLGFAVLSPLSYGLFLFALALAPVSLVAPLREVSILIGVALGGHLLAESDTPRRALAAAAMVVGIAALAAG